MSEFTLTSTAVAAEARTQPKYVNTLRKEGLLPFVMTSSGVALYNGEAPQIVARIKAERLARRGFRRG